MSDISSLTQRLGRQLGFLRALLDSKHSDAMLAANDEIRAAFAEATALINEAPGQQRMSPRDAARRVMQRISDGCDRYDRASAAFQAELAGERDTAPKADA